MLMLAFASLRHRWIRTIVTALSVTISIGIFTVTFSVVRRLSEITQNFSQPRVVVIPVIGDLPLVDAEQLRKIPGVAPDIEYYHYFEGTDGDRLHFPVWGASDGFTATYPPALHKPDPGAEERWRADKQGILISQSTMEKLGWKEGQLVTVKTDIGPVQGKIDGVDRSYRDHVVFHYEYLNQQLPADKRNYVTRFSVGCRQSECSAVASAIEAALENTEAPAHAITQEAFFESGNRNIAAIPDLLTSIGALVVIVTALVTASTIAISLRERRGEFGALRAIGFTRRRIVGLIFAESVVVCVLGGVFGAVLPFVIYHSDGFRAGGLQLGNVTVGLAACLIGLGASLLLGLLVAIVPAIGIVRQDIITALQGD